MEETEVLPDMSVNFKDFAVETRFVVVICSGACATFSTRTAIHKLIGSLSFNFPSNSL